ncbi:MAG: ATP-binding cassette domain-containing protein, partial [Ornithinibacter sp.]
MTTTTSSLTSDAAVHARGLVKTFGAVRAVDGIDLDVHRGEVFGVLGPNGAGKTTMLQMLATLLPMDGGDAQLFGVDVRRHPHVIRQLLGVTGQYASVDENLTGRENLWLFGRLLGLSSKQARTTAEDLLGRFGLDDAGDKAIAKYSGGMRRRLDLAASLISRPPLIFLDEPTTGLDPRTRGQMWDTIRELVAEGCTVLLTTQYLDEADRLADDIAVIDHGVVIERGTPTELKQRVGGEQIVVVATHTADAPRIVEGLSHFACGDAHVEDAGRRIVVPVQAVEGLVPLVVRRLDDLGVSIDDVGVRHSSL